MALYIIIRVMSTNTTSFIKIKSSPNEIKIKDLKEIIFSHSWRAYEGHMGSNLNILH